MIILPTFQGGCAPRANPSIHLRWPAVGDIPLANIASLWLPRLSILWNALGHGFYRSLWCFWWFASFCFIRIGFPLPWRTPNLIYILKVPSTTGCKSAYCPASLNSIRCPNDIYIHGTSAPLLETLLHPILNSSSLFSSFSPFETCNALFLRFRPWACRTLFLLIIHKGFSHLCQH